jgi:hypothetical protein
MNAHTRRGIIAISASAALAVVANELLKQEKTTFAGASVLLVSASLSGLAGREIVMGALREEVL